jgi:hypothetical protein
VKEIFFPRLNQLPAVKISGDGTSQDTSYCNPPPDTCIGTPEDHGGAPYELCTEVSNSDTHSDIDESELGEFLLDTFDAMESQGNLLAQLELPN